MNQQSKELSSLIRMAYKDIEGALLLSRSSNMLGEFVDNLPAELLIKLNPNLK